MTLLELSGILRDMYENAPKGEAKTMIHLFGIKYADEINSAGFSKKEIIASAGLPSSYETEIYNGVRLAKYVSIK